MAPPGVVRRRLCCVALTGRSKAETWAVTQCLAPLGTQEMLAPSGAYKEKKGEAALCPSWRPCSSKAGSQNCFKTERRASHLQGGWVWGPSCLRHPSHSHSFIQGDAVKMITEASLEGETKAQKGIFGVSVQAPLSPSNSLHLFPGGKILILSHHPLP